MKQRLLAFAALPLMLASLSQAVAADAPAKPTITIALDQTKAKIDPKFYGLMTEEINFAYEGGLYGELLRNRTIKGEEGIAYRADNPIYWSPVGAGTVGIDWAYPLNDIQHISLAVDASKAAPGHAVGVANTGYWGVPARPNTTYTASFFAHAEGDAGPIKLAIVSDGARPSPRPRSLALVRSGSGLK